MLFLRKPHSVPQRDLQPDFHTYHFFPKIFGFFLKKFFSLVEPQVVKDTCEPVYEESFSYDLEPSWLDSVSLEVSVVDRKGIFARSPLMGRAVVPLSQPGVASASGVTEWHDLVSNLLVVSRFKYS